MSLENIKEIVDTAKVVLLDIEGTTTSISFVKDVLFPYSDQFLQSYVETHWDDDQMKEVVDILRQDQIMYKNCPGFVLLPSESDALESHEIMELVIKHLRWLQSNDFKCTGLKRIQGRIWKEGYLTGSIKAHIYEDVPRALIQWKSMGKKIIIYSSGSIEAQKLLFSNTFMGSLNDCIDGNFDTTIGSKTDVTSYYKIAKELNVPVEEIVFFTDRPKEVFAAKESGIKVVRMVRDDPNPYLEEEKQYIGLEHGTLTSFSIISEDNL